MSSVLDLRLLQHFTVVYRLESFSQAASEVGLSQSALTKRVQQLESDLGVALFHRTTRSVMPTEAGRRLYRRALDLLAQAGTVREETLAGELELKIIAGPQMLETLVIPALKCFRTQRPEVRLTILSMPPTLALDELLQRRAHLILFHDQVIRALPHQDRLEITEVINEPYVVVCRPGHPILDGDGSLRAMLDHDWVTISHSQSFLEDVWIRTLPPRIAKMLLAAGWPHIRVSAASAALDLVRTEGLLSYVPRSMVAPAVARGELAELPVGIKAMPRARFSVATLEGVAREPGVAAFLKTLGEVGGIL